MGRAAAPARKPRGRRLRRRVRRGGGYPWQRGAAAAVDSSCGRASQSATDSSCGRASQNVGRGGRASNHRLWRRGCRRVSAGGGAAATRVGGRWQRRRRRRRRRGSRCRSRGSRCRSRGSGGPSSPLSCARARDCSQPRTRRFVRSGSGPDFSPGFGRRRRRGPRSRTCRRAGVWSWACLSRGGGVDDASSRLACCEQVGRHRRRVVRFARGGS